MEEGQIEGFEDTMEITTSCSHIDPVNPIAHSQQLGSPSYGTYAENPKMNGNAKDQISPNDNTPPSVSNCYVFKSQLQEFAQKAGLMTPVYETLKEGPSHEPSFKSTVILNNVRYDSLPGFFSRKAAEQSAAEVALIELSKSADLKFGISQPLHQSGLCKNLLQEYAQKRNYAKPLYVCSAEEKKKGKVPMYSCVVEIGGIKYIGASASTKKEAEIKAARTALLAIQSTPSASGDYAANSTYTVIPLKKKVPDLGLSTQKASAALKPKKSRFKKQKKIRRISIPSEQQANVADLAVQETVVTDASGTQENEAGVFEISMDCQAITDAIPSEQEANVADLAVQETVVTDASGCQENEAGVFEINMDCQAITELSVTNLGSSQGTDSGLAVMANTDNVSDAGAYNGNLENSLVRVDGRVFKDCETSALVVNQ